MEIIPGRGTDTITFGMSGTEVKRLVGAPDTVTPLGDQPDYPHGRENWGYRTLDILMTRSHGVIAVTVECMGAEVRLWDQNIAGCDAETLTASLQQTGETPEISEVDQWGDFDIQVSGAGLMFYFSDDGLMSVEIQKPGWEQLA